MEEIEVVNVRYEEDRFLEQKLKNLFPKVPLPSVMNIDILYENEPILLSFLENQSQKWELEEINFVDKDNKLTNGFDYGSYRKKQLGKKRVWQIKCGIKANIDTVLNDPKVRLRRIIK